MRPAQLFFGTAGIPSSTDPYNTVEGVKTAKMLGLGAMELEFVHSINITEQKAPEVAAAADETGILLTAHAPYYINLNAVEKEKAAASAQRILTSARRLHQCHGWSCTFHPAFYLKDTPAQTYATVKQAIGRIVRTLQDEGNHVWVRPETTGKPTQFGSLQELLQLSQELDQVMPCIDFAHLHARSNGKYNTTQEFHDVLEQVEKTLGKEGLHNMHIHLSGINYGPKGERNHLMLKDSDLQYKELVAAWKAFNIRGVVICESPDPQADALLLQETYKKTT